MSTPPPPDLSPALAVVVLGRVIGRRVDAALAEAGTSVREIGVLGHLSAAPGMSITDLARRSGVTVQSMHTLVAALVERGLVDRGSAAGRGRTAQLAVTPAGRLLQTRARRALATVDQHLFADPSIDVMGALGMLPPGGPSSE